MTAATRRRKTPAVLLAGIVKTRVLQGRRGPETWGAQTTDGEWGMDRLEDAGTSWEVVHRPTKTVVAEFMGSLRQCRIYVASGEAREDLEAARAAGTEKQS